MKLIQVTDKEFKLLKNAIEALWDRDIVYGKNVLNEELAQRGEKAVEIIRLRNRLDEIE